MKKRILSFFLAIISTFSLVVPVFATNTQLTLGQFYRRVVVDYYKDADYTEYGCSESYYQWWG